MFNPFWNSNERRLRALWRLILQAIVFLFFVIVLYILIIAIQLGEMAASGTPFPTDPAQFAVNPLLTTAASPIMVIAIVLSFLVASKLLDRRPFAAFGFHFNRRWFEDLGFGLALGAGLMVFIFFTELVFGWITITGTLVTNTPSTSFAAGLLQTVLLFLAVGIYEEMFSRGYQLRNLAEGLNLPKIGPKAALLLGYFLSSAIFGYLHATNPNATVISTVNLVIAGLFLGLGFILTGELAIPIGLHITWNFFQGNVFGFPVSGTTPIVTFIAIRQGGSDLVTGGAFGPEAGLIGLVAIAIGSALIFQYLKWRDGKVSLKIDLAIYSPSKKQPEKSENEIATTTAPRNTTNDS